MVLMMLEYLREYRTYSHIGASYGLSETSAFNAIRWVENVLIQRREFSLPGKRAFYKDDFDLEVVLDDAAESPIQRPKKQKRHYTGKKKRHTMKTQIVVDKKSQTIIAVDFAKGKCHDFNLYKKSNLHPKETTIMLSDTEYLCLQKLHKNTLMPKKKTKNKPLTKEDKRINRALSSVRVSNEYVIGKIRRFKIVADPHRNRRKRFCLRFNLIAGICNHELQI